VFLLIDIKTPPFFDTSFFGFFIKTIIPLLKQAGNGLLFCFILSSPKKCIILILTTIPLIIYHFEIENLKNSLNLG
jgi:hypothetical protein